MKNLELDNFEGLSINEQINIDGGCGGVCSFAIGVAIGIWIVNR